MEWGTAEVMQQTRKRLQQLQIDWVETASLWDIYRPEDYQRYIEEQVT